MNGNEKKYYIAAEGGGTKTRALLYDDSFSIISDETMPGTNTFIKSKGTVAEEIKVMLDKLLPQYVTVIDIANIAVMKYGELFLDILKGKCSVKAVNFFKESDILLSSSQNRYGIVVQSGTGSAVFLSQPDRLFMSGGWGFLLGDEGSGYDIGLKSLKAAIAYEEGLGPETVMLNYIREAWKTVKTRELINRLFEKNDFVSKIASVAYITSRAAYEKDPAAIRIYEQAARDLADRTLKLIEKNDNQWIGPIITSGGAWKGYPDMYRTFCKELHARYADAVIEFPKYEPIVGCMLLGHNNTEAECFDKYLYGADQNGFS